MASQSALSSIAMALAGKSASVDIPKPRPGVPFAPRDASRSGQSGLLPTPPNSISPSIPPRSFKYRGDGHARTPSSGALPESDIDLGDAADAAKGNGQLRAQDLDSVGAITPGMLAKYHLPRILLEQGPLPIRHVMSCLTTSVPGFSRIPPAKARRLLVSALEGRGSEDGGQDEVIFEKVGWGRWDARRRDEPPRDHQFSPPSSVSTSFPQGLQIPGNSTWKSKHLNVHDASVAEDSIAFSHSEMGYGGDDVDMLEDEADKMSFDGDQPTYCSSSEAPDGDIPEDDWGEDDMTDEEDWASIGAAALRARSLNGGGGFVSTFVAQKQPLPHLRGGGPPPSALAKSAPRPANGLPNTEEQAAVEALLRLGST